MRTWSAFARSVLGLLGAAALLLLAAGPAAAGDAGGERIRSYQVSLEVRPDGSMQVRETLEYDFGGNARHGIERDIDTEQRYDGSRDRRYPVSEIEVSSPTAPDQVQVTESGGRTRLRIGDPDRTITGRATYRISYLVAAATTRYADRDELYWNAVGPGWSVPVDRAEVQVGGAQVTGAACYAGRPGTRTPCPSARPDGSTATYGAGPLAAGDALTVVAAFPAGSVAAAAPVLVDRLTLRRFAAGRPAVVLPVAAVLVALPLWRLVTVVRRRRARAAAVPPAAAAEPPPGMRPVLVSTVLHGRFKPVDQSALLLDLAARGYLSISPASGGDWRLVAGRPPDGELRPEELILLRAAFADDPSPLLSKVGRKLGAVRYQVRDQVYADVVALGWFSARPGSGKVLPAVLGGLALAAAIPTTVLAGFLLHAAVVGLALGAAGVLLVAGALLTPAPRTPAGEAARVQLVAFRQFLGGIDPARLPPEQRQVAVAGLLPYAVVLALAPQLAQALQAAGVGFGYADPLWFSTFSSDATRVSSSSSSSGGSGGGGFSGSSGGGGGGGGGGSW